MKPAGLANTRISTSYARKSPQSLMPTPYMEDYCNVISLSVQKKKK